MARWMLAFLFLTAAGPAPLEMTIDPRPGASGTLLFAGPADGTGKGEFRGAISLNGSSVELPLSGRAQASGGRARVETTIRYADVPADWLTRFRPDSFDYNVHGSLSGAGTVSWSGTMRWKEVTVSGSHEGLSYFVKLASLELTALSLQRSEGRAVLAVKNPFSFPVTVAAASYRVRVNGEEIGGGVAPEQKIRANRTNGLELPFSVDNGRFLAAAGGDWAVGADVDAKIDGSLTLRLPGASLSIPLNFSAMMGTDGARSGVFSHPDGATSLSPHR